MEDGANCQKHRDEQTNDSPPDNTGGDRETPDIDNIAPDGIEDVVTRERLMTLTQDTDVLYKGLVDNCSIAKVDSIELSFTADGVRILLPTGKKTRGAVHIFGSDTMSLYTCEQPITATVKCDELKAALTGADVDSLSLVIEESSPTKLLVFLSGGEPRECGIVIKKKKKPGRPKKETSAVPIEVHGIVTEPGVPDDVVEMVYCNPAMFKKLLMLFKNFEVSEIEMNFGPTGLNIVTNDHLGKSTIHTFINGKCMNLYYCKQPVRICIKRGNLEMVLGTLDKNNYKITFILKENYRSTVYIIVKDLEYDIDNSYEIDVVFKPEDPTITNNQDDCADYPVKFVLTSKHFKSLISNVRKLSQVITLQKVGDGPIQFTYPKAQRVNWTGVYSGSAKLLLESTLEPDEIFLISINIDYIKPFSGSNIGDTVKIAAHPTKRISFVTNLDRTDNGYACCVTIFTEIKDYRQKAIPV